MIVSMREKKKRVLVFNMEALAALLSMAELSSSIHCCLGKENRTGERLASINVTITRIICTNASIQNRTLSLCSQSINKMSLTSCELAQTTKH